MSEESQTAADTEAAGEASSLEHGTYEILRDRLREHAADLRQRADRLNSRRLELFGGTEMKVIGNERIRTENNCVPRDIRATGRYLLFGYQVFLGLRTDTKVDDVLSLHSFQESEGRFSFEEVSGDDRSNYLADSSFVSDFRELFKYYKNARLLQIRRTETKLLAVFQIGAGAKDLRVFRWAVEPDGRVRYIDGRGERDHTFPPSHDFEWTPTTREDHVHGRHPHVNILDEVFVETVGGDLTVKVEDNTEDGLGIYREEVADPRQSLDDADIAYARVGTLILLKIRPYNEEVERFLVFNTRNQQVDRIDAIGRSCLLLPEDHGLIFPGGYYLQSGETKTFEGDVAAMEFLKKVRSPNGEDVLFIFHERESGRSILLSYNMIRKDVQNPIYCHGYSFFEDGRMVIFNSQSDEPTRVHPMQIWQTPFMSDLHAAQVPSRGTFLETFGNPDLVRGISDSLSICRAIEEQTPSAVGYEDLIASTVRAADAYYWLTEDEAEALSVPLAEIRATAELIVDEFAKVQALRRRAAEAVDASSKDVDTLWEELRRQELASVDRFVDALDRLRHQRGHLLTLRELRYVDLGKLDELETLLAEKFDELSDRMVGFLQEDSALAPYLHQIERQVAEIETVETAAAAEPIREAFEGVGNGLELLTEVIGGLEISDATIRTRILEDVSEILSGLNRGRALLEARRKELMTSEGAAEFGAQFKLLGQAVSGALAMCDTPEKCDDQLSKLLLQLEELESRFGEFDDFLDQLATKREDVYEAFSSRKQALLDERQRRAGRMLQAADRILQGIVRRASALGDADELNTYFVGDAMVAKVRDLAGQLRKIQESVKADELESRLKAAKEDAARSLRDRQEIFEGGAEVLKLGRHRFSVNTQPFDLTLVPRTGERESDLQMALHLTGTDYYEVLDDPEFNQTRDVWNQLLVSETPRVYRGEYLAACLLAAAEAGEAGLDLARLQQAALDRDQLLAVVRRWSSERYEEGYERGLHDHDATLILEKLLALYGTADLLRFTPAARSLACLFWAFFSEQTARATWERQAQSLGRLRARLGHSPAITELAEELSRASTEFLTTHGLEVDEEAARQAGQYLFEELTQHPVRFTTSGEAAELEKAFTSFLKENADLRSFQDDLGELENDLANRHRLTTAWLDACLARGGDPKLRALARARDEVVASLLTTRRLERRPHSGLQELVVEDLLGQHPRIKERKLTLRLDEFLARLTTFRSQRVPRFRHYQEVRHQLLETKRRELRLGEYQPKVMSAFVRNRLINEVYLPIFGDNLAKQMGSLGEGKRTDQMGLLLLISPPGYGKTTLMEYIANRLGMVFVKINGPALGHAVTSIDPSEAPNATARQEVEKINFALEMGNNVLLYLDDIQHTHPELLQKFISLCDAQRRIEGVWKGRTRTYDLRGKRFAICMAGNPYTEAGEKFQIPDMLANRADTYNLGDILEGREEVFALSYLENALTSNPALAPLTTREPGDIHKLFAMAAGNGQAADQLSHEYSGVELEEMLSVLRKLLRIQQILLAVNQEYISSASQDDAFRTEPRFQLQGSYRNMNKLAEKIVAVMNERELESLVDDHYQGEAQTLTTGAEHNLLKLAELRGVMTTEQEQRWEEIKRGFARVQAMGGAEDDPATRLIGQIGLVSERLHHIGDTLAGAAKSHNRADADAETTELQMQRLERALESALAPLVSGLEKTLQGLAAEPTSADDLAPRLENGARLVSQQLAAVVERLDHLGQSLAGLGNGERAPAADLAPHFEALARSIATIAERRPPALPAAAAEATPASADLSPYLERLDDTLRSLAEAPKGREIIQTLKPGVHDVLGRLAVSIDENLLPLVQGIGRHLKSEGIADDRKLTKHLDRTLKYLDMMKGLVLSLRRIDTRDLSTE